MSGILLPMPHAGQRRVRSEARRFNVLAAGRRWRKTTMVMPIAVETVLAGGTVVWGAPTYDQVATAYEETIRAGKGVIRFRRSPSMEAEIPGAGRILFRSLDDPDNARSKTAHGVVIDEGGDVAEVAWYEVLRPMLIDTGGWAWIIGTPKGRNWFWREHVAAADRPDWRAWQIPTLGCEVTPGGLVRKPHPYENPHIQFSELEAMFAGMAEARFRQEILAEFVEDAGGVFRGVMACATGALERPRPGSFVLGVDWGKENDFTVLVLLEVDTGRVVDFDRFNRIDWHLQRRRLWEMFSRWTAAGGRVSILAEANSIGGPQIEALQRGDRGEGIPAIPVQPFVTSQTSKGQVIEALQLAIETRRLCYPNRPEIVNELQAFEQTRRPSGVMAYSAPDGMHDDVVMALAIANFGRLDGASAAVSSEDVEMFDRLEREPVDAAYSEGRGLL